MRQLPRRIRRRIRDAMLVRRLGAIVAVNTALPMVALTFDDGPHPEYTPRLIELFSRYGAKATHFLVGASAMARPDLVNALVDAGHVVASHGYAHRSLVRLVPRVRREEIQRGVDALLPRHSDLFRPPFGHYDLATARSVHAMGLRCVMWSSHIRDWEPSTADELRSRLERSLKPGAIVLLHEALFSVTADNQEDREPLFEAVEAVLAANADKIRFGTFDELMAQGTPELRIVEKRGEDSFIDAQEPGSVQRALGDILLP